VYGYRSLSFVFNSLLTCHKTSDCVVRCLADVDLRIWEDRERRLTAAECGVEWGWSGQYELIGTR
jgi:hypothetical protein